MQPKHIAAIPGFLVLLVISLAACSNSISVQGSTSPTPAGSTATATQAPFSAALCSAALPSSNPATAIGGGAPGANDIPVPPNSAVTPITPVSGGDLATVSSGIWTRYTVQLCTENTTPSAITSFYTTQMPAQGWATASQNKEPYDGSYQEPCSLHGSGICWQKDPAPRYVSLESVTDQGKSVVTYTLRLLDAPATPNCTDSNYASSPLQGYQSFAQIFSVYVPFPPLTKLAPNSASGGQRGYEICSAGSSGLDVASIMDTELPKEGWSVVSESVIPGGVDQTWQHSGNKIHFQITDPTNWELDYRVLQG